MRPMNQCPTSGNNDYHIYVYVFVVVVTTMIREWINPVNYYNRLKYKYNR